MIISGEKCLSMSSSNDLGESYHNQQVTQLLSDVVFRDIFLRGNDL